MIKVIKVLLRPAVKFLEIFGFNLQKILALRNYSKYCKHRKEFQRLGGNITRRYAILSDFTDQAGSAKGHYFHQDLLVASLIFKNKPHRHIDIGSRIDGFVAHVAAYREIEVIDIRDLESTGHKNIVFKKADLMDDDSSPKDITDSLSCLNAIEHFGLGRYGDPLDPIGHIKGFRNMLKMVKPNGTLYISVPIGRCNEVHFNAHRIFDPTDIFNWSDEKGSLRLDRFDYVDDAGKLNQRIDINTEKIDVAFGCGIYSFTKLF